MIPGFMTTQLNKKISKIFLYLFILHLNHWVISKKLNKLGLTYFINVFERFFYVFNVLNFFWNVFYICVLIRRLYISVLSVAVR